jgi:hypothetical protein
MSFSITSVVASNHDERFFPGAVTLTFSNGEKASYVHFGEEVISEKSTLASFNQHKFDLGDDVKTDGNSFEDIGNKYVEKLRSLEKLYRSAAEEADRLLELEQTKVKDFADKRLSENKQLFSSISMEMMRNYKQLKKLI